MKKYMLKNSVIIKHNIDVIFIIYDVNYLIYRNPIGNLSFQEDIHNNVHLYNDQDGKILNALLYFGLDLEQVKITLVKNW